MCDVIIEGCIVLFSIYSFFSKTTVQSVFTSSLILVSYNTLNCHVLYCDELANNIAIIIQC